MFSIIQFSFTEVDIEFNPVLFGHWFCRFGYKMLSDFHCFVIQNF